MAYGRTPIKHAPHKNILEGKIQLFQLNAAIVLTRRVHRMCECSSRYICMGCLYISTSTHHNRLPTPSFAPHLIPMNAIAAIVWEILKANEPNIRPKPNLLSAIEHKTVPIMQSTLNIVRRTHKCQMHQRPPEKTTKLKPYLTRTTSRDNFHSNIVSVEFLLMKTIQGHYSAPSIQKIIENNLSVGVYNHWIRPWWTNSKNWECCFDCGVIFAACFSKTKHSNSSQCRKKNRRKKIHSKSPFLYVIPMVSGHQQLSFNEQTSGKTKSNVCYLIYTIKQEYKLIELFAVFFAKILRRPKRQPQYHHKEKAINECHSEEFKLYIFF